MALILYAVATFDRGTAIPGFPALIPTCGAGLIILFATGQTYVGTLLSLRPVVGMGFVSYSAYLWHNPILVFARYTSPHEPGIWLMGALCLATIVFAYVS